MVTNDELNSNDTLDEAVRAFQRMQIPEGPDSQTVASSLVAIHQAAEGRDQQITQRRFTMQRIRRMSVAAILVFVLFGLFHWMSPRDDGASVVFAEAIENLQNAETLSLDMFLKALNAPDQQEVRIHCEFKGNRFRYTTENGPVLINDGNIGKTMTLMPDRMVATISPSGAPGEPSIQQMLDLVAQAREGTTEELGNKEIEGRSAVGFRATVNDQTNDCEVGVEVWVDVETNLPVRIEMLIHEDGIRGVLTNFVWNPELDDSLFDLTLPEGYSEFDGKN